MTTDIVRARAHDERTRLAYGYMAQQGACNPSGLLYDIQYALNGCCNEGISGSTDVGTSLMVHQLKSLMRYPNYEAMQTEYEDAKNLSLTTTTTTTDLLRITIRALERCRELRSDPGSAFSTETLYNDGELRELVTALYVGTLAEHFDYYTGDAYRLAYSQAEAAHKETSHA